MQEEYLSKDLVLAIVRDKDIEHKERAINRLPSANVKTVTMGEWIYSATYAFGGKAVQAFKCSECGCKMLEADEVAHFCPNCGADMRGKGSK